MNRPTVLFISGFAQPPCALARLAATVDSSAWHTETCSVATLDERFSASSGYAGAVLSMLEGGPPAVLVGWSMGGLVALEAALVAPERIAALVLLGSTARLPAAPDYPEGVPPENARALRLALRKRPRLAFEQFYGAVYGEEHDKSRIKEKIDAALRLDQEALLRALGYLDSTDLRGDLGRIPVPALVVHGAADRIISPAAGASLAEKLHGSRFITLPGAHHGVYETNPELIAPYISTVLADVGY